MEEAEGNPSMGQSCYEKTMNTSALPWSTISKCVEEEYDSVQTAAMNATPKHQCNTDFLFFIISLTLLCVFLRCSLGVGRWKTARKYLHSPEDYLRCLYWSPSCILCSLSQSFGALLQHQCVVRMRLSTLLASC